MRLVSFRVCVITAEGKYDDMLCQIARLLISESDGRLETNKKKKKRYKEAQIQLLCCKMEKSIE